MSIILGQGQFTWGGKSNIEKRLRLNQIDRGFAYRFYHSGVSQPVSILALIPTFEPVNDQL